MTRDELTNEEIRDILCAPEPTDDIEDIDFDEDFDEEAERKFIEDSVNGWLKERSGNA
jgi:hypothetical protein